ncbi:MAG: hypothetical protein BGN98_13675 [Microbacterium sp. 69-7]|uniref:hypothetical protein n=1 Tax=Microbacterium sp. 69-7 TaxID=1895784 RepID=UPI000964D026|nr:hypothetical protein [Microbacterium sp. 69-7]OJU44429.1 MAG: hypothetical protein BGN98_13675 [Microbacterium sp. 69-7]
MTTVAIIAAWVYIALTVIVLLALPFSIGKPREPRTAGDYVATFIISLALIGILVILMGGQR